MGLTGILDLLGESAAFQSTVRAMRDADGTPMPLSLTAPDAARGFLLAGLCRGLRRPMLVVTAKPEDADRISDELATVLGEDRDAPAVLRLPESEALPYERLAEDEAVAHDRLGVLSALLTLADGADGPGLLLVASVAALCQRTLRPDQFQDTTHVLTVGQRVQTGALLVKWAAMGYSMEPTIEAPGTASRRGGILDVYPPSAAAPVRIEFFGDVIEDIRTFDPLTQRSAEPVGSVTITPALDHPVNPEALEAIDALLDSTTIDADPLDRMREDVERMDNGESIGEAAFYAGFLCDGSPLDYLPTRAVVAVLEPDRVAQEAETLEEQAAALLAAKVARRELPDGWASPWWPWSAVSERIEGHAVRLHLNWMTPSAADGPGGLQAFPAPGFWGRLDAFAQDAKERARAGERVVVLSHHAERLQEVLRGYDVGAALPNDIRSAPLPGSITLAATPLQEGMHLELESGALTVFTDMEVFGHAKRRRTLRRHAARREAFLTELVPGAYVVHIDHGIARFAGVRRVAGEHGEREYLTLEYAEGDKLYVPSEHLDRLSPYVAPGDDAPTLTRLGSQEWTRAKERAQRAAREMAGELVALYAARQVLPGHAFSPDTIWQHEMEDAFPYAETRDQLEAIDAVKESMEAPHPMDHLVCGDVGYGKTEIAVRAAFQGCAGRAAGGRALPHDDPRAAALRHLRRPAQPLPGAHRGAQPLPHPSGAGRHHPETAGRRSRHRHRHAPGAAEGRALQQAGARGRRRRAAVRRCPQGVVQAASAGGGRPHAYRHAHSAHALDGAGRGARHDHGAHAAAGAPARPHLVCATTAKAWCRRRCCGSSTGAGRCSSYTTASAPSTSGPTASRSLRRRPRWPSGTGAWTRRIWPAS